TEDFANTGLVQIGGELDLAVAGSFANTGTLALAAGATLDLRADTSLASLGHIDNAGGAVKLGGTLDLGGATLSDAPGGAFVDLVLAGTVRDGTLVSAGGTLAAQGATFDAMTYAGTLDLSALGTATTLAVADGITVTGGTIAVTAAGDTLQVLDSETLDGLRLNLGAPGGEAALRGDAAGTLALGADTVLHALGGEMTVSAATLVNQGEVTVAAGALSMAATTLSNVGTMALGGTGSSLVLQGETLANGGEIQIGGGDTPVLQSVTYQDQPAPAGFANAGTLTLNPGGVLDLDANATLAGLGAIGGTGGTLVIAPEQAWFQSRTGGVLDLAGGTLAIGAGSPFSDVVVEGTIENGTIKLLPGGTFDPPASAAELNVTVVPCYLAGTRLLTTKGEVPVEALAVGTRAVTAGGRARPVVWIGERSIDCRRHARPQLVWPVRVRAHAFGPGLPTRDLLLSPDHAVSVAAAGGAGNVLVPIRHLVNGLTVVQEPAATVRYFHVELATHDLLLAEGLPAESYLDTGNRDTFAVSRGGRAGRRRRPLSWADACAPLREAGADVDAARQRLQARAAALGWRENSRAGLHLRTAERPFAPALVKGRLHRFLLPERTHEAEIVSHSAAPACIGEAWRRLGVCIGGILVNGRIVPLDSTALGAGFHATERADGEAWRWTDGAARLSFERARGRLAVELLLREPEAGRRPARVATPVRAAA
ncbi:MAG: Hint domain-containing protein, partial [Alphaproteobacteria bacterium]|nr:Hint domain-containing protein [Alphaproteobacteria bacterium]